MVPNSCFFVIEISGKWETLQLYDTEDISGADQSIQETSFWKDKRIARSDCTTRKWFREAEDYGNTSGTIEGGPCRARDWAELEEHCCW